MASSDVRCHSYAVSWAKLTANLKTRESPQLSRKFLFDPSKGQSQQALSGFSLACFAAVNKLSLFWAVVFWACPPRRRNMTQGGGDMLTSKMPQRCSPTVSFRMTFTTAEAHLWKHLDMREATLGKQSQHHSEHSPWSPRRLASPWEVFQRHSWETQ